MSFSKENFNRGLAKIKMGVNQHSPELLLVAGVATFVGTVVVACKSTVKAADIIADHNETMEAANELHNRIEAGETELAERYSDQDYKNEVIRTTVETGVALTKTFAPAVILGGVSLACFLSSYGIMKKRYTAVVVAYKAVDTAFKQYRSRVVEKLGAEADQEFRYGLRKDKVETKYIDENGKEKKKKEEVTTFDPNAMSGYAKIFDESNINWEKSPEMNKQFILLQQNYLNSLLQANGYVFLNDAYKALGFPKTDAGQIVGWSLKENPGSYIDFGLFTGRERTNDFINGYERSVILDFNVDGPIIGKAGLQQI